VGDDNALADGHGAHLPGVPEPHFFSKLFQTCLITFVLTITMLCGVLVLCLSTLGLVLSCWRSIKSRFDQKSILPAPKKNFDPGNEFYATDLGLGVGVTLNLEG